MIFMKRLFIIFWFSVLLQFLPVANIIAQIVVPANGCVTESFDASNTWTFGGANPSWIWANPNKAEITDDITGGGNCLILGGNGVSTWVNDWEDSWAESPEYDLSAVNNPYLEFWFYHSNEASTNFDEIWMEYSLNNGASWSVLSAPIGTNNCYDQNWYNYTDNWGGATNAAASNTSTGSCAFGGGNGPSDWMLVRKCIVSLANESSVRFRFRSDNGDVCNFYGATVDDFTVCDAHIEADASFNCSGNLEIDFVDLSEDCPDIWLWDFGDGNTSTAQNPSHTYASEGVYTVTLTATASAAVTQGCGGPFTDSYTFDVEMIDASVVSQMDPTCAGDSDGSATIDYLGNTGAVNINWSPAPGTGQGTTTGTGLSDGTYLVEVSSSAVGCPGIATINITDPPVPTFNVNAVDETCSNGNGYIVVDPSGSITPYSFSTDGGATFVASDSFPGLSAGNYDIVIENGDGCQSALSTVTINDIPLSISLSSDTSICEGEFTPLNAAPGNGTVPFTYNWYCNQMNCAADNQSSSAINVNPAQSTMYYVEVTDGNGCTALDSVEITVIPSTLVDAGSDVVINEGDSTMLSATPQGASSYSWTPAGTLSDPNSQNPYASPLSTTSYYVTVTAGVCPGTDSVTVFVSDLNVNVPNVFTPGGDGYNDHLIIEGVEFFPENKLEVYNRWGQLIFSAEDYDNDNVLWSGINMEGEELSDGVYFYVFVGNRGEVQIEKNGTISIFKER